MLGNITNDNLITGNSVHQNENIKELEKNEGIKNPYVKSAEFYDSLEVSREAKELFQKEKDIEFFKSLVLESPFCSKDEVDAILKLIQEGEFIDNKDLAEAMKADNNLLNHLFLGADIAS